MVHRGPSKGCLRCKKAHKSCDQAKPSCLRCTRRGFQCPGYSDVGGFTFREQDVKKTHYTRDTPSPAHETTSAICSLPHDPIDFVVTFFAKSVQLTADGRSIALAVGLLPMYVESASSSAIYMALNTLAGQLTAMALKRPDTSPWHLKQYDRTISTILATLAPSGNAGTQEEQRLLAVAMLGTTAGLQSVRRGSPISVVHHLGAAALARRLGKTCQPSPFLSIVFATVRRGMLMCAHDSSSSDSDLIADAVSHVDPGDDSPKEYPSAQLDILALRVLKLRRDLNRVITQRAADTLIQDLADRIHLLHDRVQEWGHDVPPDWHPTLPTPRPESPDRALESYPTIDVAITYNHWRCTKLLIARLLQQISSLLPDAYPCSSVAPPESVEYLVEAILSAAPFLDGEDVHLPSDHPDHAFLQGAMILRRWQYYRVLKHLAFALELDRQGSKGFVRVEVPSDLFGEVRRRIGDVTGWLQRH